MFLPLRARIWHLGATVVAHIELPPKQGILVPRTALLEDSSGPYIFTIADETAHKQNVKVLVETEDMALIDGVDPALGTKVVIEQQYGTRRRHAGPGGQVMNLALWASQHRRSLIFLLLVAALAGAVSALSLPVALFPQVSFPRIAITVDAGDQPADQMVTLVTRPVEQAIKSVPGLVDVRSTTSRGTSEFSLNFDWGTDMSVATLQSSGGDQPNFAVLCRKEPPSTSGR